MNGGRNTSTSYLMNETSPSQIIRKVAISPIGIQQSSFTSRSDIMHQFINRLAINSAATRSKPVSAPILSCSNTLLGRSLTVVKRSCSQMYSCTTRVISMIGSWWNAKDPETGYGHIRKYRTLRSNLCAVGPFSYWNSTRRVMPIRKSITGQMSSERFGQGS